MSPQTPDINQLQDHMRFFIAYLAINHKAELVGILNANGVSITTQAPEKNILTAVYTAIRHSKAFRANLQQLMTSVAAKELNITGPIGANSVNEFVKGIKGNTKKSFDGSPDEVYTDPGAMDQGTTYAPENYWGNVGADTTELSTLSDTASPITGSGSSSSSSPGYIGVPKPFSQTAVGSFLGSLFSKDNVNKAVGTGIGLLGQKLAANSTKAQLDAATALEVAKTQALMQQQQQTATTKSFLIPGLIIGGVVLIVVVALMVHKKS